MNQDQIQRALRAIERERAEKEQEIRRLDSATAALTALLPDISSNGHSSTPRPRLSRGKKTRVRGAKNEIERMLKGAPGESFLIAEIKNELDRRHLLNPRAQDPEKQIGTALRRLRDTDPRFQRVGPGMWAFILEGSGLGPTSASKTATPEEALGRGS